MNIVPASLVEVTAGRDKGKFLLVTKVLDENYVLICDGRRRKVENPKKKKIKHLRTLCYSLKSIKEKLDLGIEINNSQVRKSIREGLIELKIL
ncbi:MAG: KOW domain-containing RNA-binding protein [Clostridia bacterium]|nr:KOW domain-containing RNA-binding protein [Clostridia bacterium]